MKTLFTAAAAVASLVATLGPASAALVTKDIVGTVDGVVGASNIAVGDTISGSVTYDDAGVASSAFSFVPLDGSTSTLEAGSLELIFPDEPNDLVLTETDDNLFGLGFPSINFDPSGNFVGFSMRVTGINAFGFDTVDLEVRAPGFAPTVSFFQGGTEVVSGTLSLQDPADDETPIPLPASFILFGMGVTVLTAAGRIARPGRHPGNGARS